MRKAGNKAVDIRSPRLSLSWVRLMIRKRSFMTEFLRGMKLWAVLHSPFAL